jgi:uncharacterized iron-regulated membrane protein
MTRSAFRKWFWVHKWASLICTAFLLVICVTGLPLIFGEEIEHLLDTDPPYVSLPANTPNANLDEIVAKSRQMYPGEIIVSTFMDDDEPKIVVTMAPSWKAFEVNRKVAHWIKYDARTAQVIRQSKPLTEEGQTFLGLMLTLHRDMFAGLPGELFLGAMGFLFVTAIVSGIAVYGPFMRKLDFATVRADRSSRLKWLDLHNMIGVVTLAWALVVGVTGVINELSTPMFLLWQKTDVKAMLEPFKGQTVPTTVEMSSVQQALETAQAAVPNMRVTSVVFPGSQFGSPFHYLLWAKGKEPLTSRLFSPVMVDARSGKLQAVVEMPWYLRALEVSRPLHFGDYGGMPLKIIWAVLDLVTILVLGSGLYLWLSRRTSFATEADTELMESNASAALALSREAAE